MRKCITFRFVLYNEYKGHNLVSGWDFKKEQSKLKRTKMRMHLLFELTDAYFLETVKFKDKK